MIKVLRKIDKPLFFVTVFMFIFGLIMIFSASYVKAITALDNAYYYLLRQGFILVVCLITFLIVINIPTKFYKRNYLLIIYFAIFLLAMLIPFGIIVNGAKSWLPFPIFNLQPSEFAKIAIIIYMAYYYDKNKNNETDYKIALKPFFIIAIVLVLVMFQPDLGTAIIMGFMAFLIFISVPFSRKIIGKIRTIILITITIGSVFFALLLLTGKSGLYEYQLQRFNFLKPCQRYTEVGTGYQVCNSYIAINNGGLFGKGIGNSTQKYLYLPESYTDFIYPVIVEELGLIVGILIILVYAYIIFRIIKISKKCYSLSSSLICYGVAMYIFVHVFINLIGVLGLFALTGVPLPFLSYGGSYALSLTLGLTLVQRINYEVSVKNQEERIKNKIREI